MQFLPFRFRAPWWVKVHTEIPQCTYYFGPFIDSQEAESRQTGYIEDLVQEGAQGISVVTQRGNPKALTVVNESDG